MNTQGISLLVSAGTVPAATKSTKASAETFDSFMNVKATNVSAKDAGKKKLNVDGKKNVSPDENVDSKSLDLKTGTKKSIMSDEQPDKEPESIDMTAMVEKARTILKNMFGLTDEELVDVMEQLGMNIQDLLFQPQNGFVNMIDHETLQQFIMGVHGVEDPAAFLTNAVLGQELNELMESLTNVAAEAFGVKPEEVPELQNNVMLDFSEQMQQTGQEPVKQMAGQEPDGKVTDAGNAEKISVTVETQQGNVGTDENQSGTQQFSAETTQTAEEVPKMESVHETQAVSIFTENLAEALEQVNQVEELAEDRTMVQVVEQVVRQVRIRVMPETTSMEMQLNPANLGRVHLTVATTGGVATASMIVENQIAKNALESQMITLKESFAQQGLKVDEVEVTVAEFGMKKEDQQQQEASDGRKQNRRFRSNSDLADENESVPDSNMTATERRDSNSVVDYTA